MNNNQENFLNELAQLFEKYSIDGAYVADKSFKFQSHEETLSFQYYRDDAFFDVITYKTKYGTVAEEE